jgi:16S rRNA A1518/A1519 N6-dimethyltransferase RsmA/KsgA/DIM1 with predicted DNA glycosylase/AP lyase activity
MKLDQHFLTDENTAKSAVELCDIKKDDTVVEIGPGNGELTKFIPKCKLILIEKDEALAKKLKTKYERVINGSGVDEIKNIKFDYLISSVPYSISEPLMRELFLHEFKKAVLILPANFVDNIESKETSLSFLANEFLEIKRISFIDRNMFMPKPRVDSYLIEVKIKKTSPILQSFYMQQDKKAKNALREAIVQAGHKTKKQAREMMEKLNISEKTSAKNVRMLSYHELKYIHQQVVTKPKDL